MIYKRSLIYKLFQFIFVTYIDVVYKNEQCMSEHFSVSTTTEHRNTSRW